MTRKEWLAVALKVAPTAIRDLVGLCGLAAVVHGVEMIYRPAGWIAGGLCLVAHAVLTARGTKAK